MVGPILDNLTCIITWILKEEFIANNEWNEIKNVSTFKGTDP